MEEGCVGGWMEGKEVLGKERERGRGKNGWMGEKWWIGREKGIARKGLMDGWTGVQMNVRKDRRAVVKQGLSHRLIDRQTTGIWMDEYPSKMV